MYTKAIIFASYKFSRVPVPIPVQFNPSEYSIESGNQIAWQTIPGLSSPIGQFISGESDKLTMELFFDTYEYKVDVRTQTALITNLVEVDPDLHAPPKCTFVWGTMIFSGIIEKVSQKYTMFLSTGIPVRATLNVSFHKCDGIIEQLMEIPRQSSDRSKHHKVVEGEQLWMISNNEYEDPANWREIAEANNIDNPLALETGKTIKVPRLY